MKYEKFNNYKGTFVFDSGIKGPTIAIFGGIHGNEIVGEKTIQYFLEKFENEEIKILKGKIIFAYGNLKAIKIRQREYTANLNRVFRKELLENESEIYEVNRAKKLAKILDESDVLLDLHSVSSQSDIFMFSEDGQKDLELAKNIFDGDIIVGYGKISDDSVIGDTESYMHNCGKLANTLECGNHNMKDSHKIGIEVSKNLLNYFGIINNGKKIKNKAKLYKIYDIFTTKTGNFKFEKIYKNLDFVKKGELIGKDSEKKIIAQKDFYIIMPTYTSQKKGKEMFFYGEKLKD